MGLFRGDYRLYSQWVMPALHSLFPNAESSHILAVKAARLGLVPRIQDDPHIKSYLATRVWDIDFDNPVGLAAGFDKDGEAIRGLSLLGFGFVEVGSVTPEPQKGNPYPRVFRLAKDRAIVNRYGFNSAGHDAVMANLERDRPLIEERKVVVGLNLGKNKATRDAADDYILGLRKFHSLDLVRYLVVNISSPNTPHLRDVQARRELASFLERVLREKRRLEESSGVRKPLLLKLSPDLSEAQLADVASVLREVGGGDQHHAPVDGLIVANTTTCRPTGLRSDPRLVAQEGGLSGAPLRDLSTRTIGRLYGLTGGTLPIVGVGGVSTGQDAFDKIAAGACLVQIYTTMAYEGPQVARQVKSELAGILARKGYRNVAEAVGVEAGPSVRCE